MKEKRIPPSICIFGDFMLDVVTHLDHLDSLKFDDLIHVPNPIEILPGGTGVIAALSAAQQGFSEISLIGKCGSLPDGQPDIAAQMILNKLKQVGIQSMLVKDINHSTGTVMITYFSEDKRILVADKGANGYFNTDDITPSLLKKVATSDIFFVSGYSLLVPEQAQAIVLFTEEAKKHGRIVVLDVVPHNIYKTIDHLLFTRYTQNVSVLISETNTLKRLFPEIRLHETIEDEREIAKLLLPRYEAVIVRSDNNCLVLYNRNGFIKEIITDYERAELSQQRGYLDRLNIRIIFEYYNQQGHAQ